MCVCGRTNTLLLLLLLLLLPLLQSVTSFPASTFSAVSTLSPPFHPPPPSPTISSSPSSPSLSIPSPTAPLIGFPTGSTEHCPLVISPSRLVVRYGGPVSANCSFPTVGYSGLLGWAASQGDSNADMAEYRVWSVDSLTEWSIQPTCYALSDQGGQCQTPLDVTVFKSPESVSLSYLNHSGPMLEGERYDLQCEVQDVAPVENLIVTFYRGDVAVSETRSSNDDSEKKPVTVNFTLSITSSREDDGVQYWCEAKLNLGPEGPQPPPVVRSGNLSTTVYFGPHFLCPRALQVREGEELKCEVTGNPPPMVTWRRDGQVVDPPTHPCREHAGNYTVSAQGALGEIFHMLNVEVLTSKGTSNANSWSFLVAVLLIQLFCWL